MQYIGEKYDPKEGKTICDAVKKGQDTIKKGDYVMLKQRKANCAQLEMVK
jgi:hypothetical protein